MLTIQTHPALSEMLNILTESQMTVLANKREPVCVLSINLPRDLSSYISAPEEIVAPSPLFERPDYQQQRHDALVKKIALVGACALTEAYYRTLVEAMGTGAFYMTPTPKDPLILAKRNTDGNLGYHYRGDLRAHQRTLPTGLVHRISSQKDAQPFDSARIELVLNTFAGNIRPMLASALGETSLAVETLEYRRSNGVLSCKEFEDLV